MAYATAKLTLIQQPLGRGPKIWMYTTSDTVAQVMATDYFSDGVAQNMQLGDLVLVFRGTLNTALTATPSTAASGAVSEFMTEAPTWGWFEVSAVGTAAVTVQGVNTLLAGNKIQIGQATSALVGFFGTTPISQRAAAALTATISLFSLTGASFVAQTSTTFSGIFGFNSTYVSQLVDAITEFRAWAVAYGLHKGGA